MSDLKGMAYLRRRLLQKRARVQTRYKYYEMKNAVKDFGMVTPPEFRTFTEVLGWCGKAVDSLADRLLWREFRDDNFDLNTIYCMNNADVLFDSAVLSALISSCCFVYISQAENGFPRLQVIDGGNATGVMDEVTGLLREGYTAVLQGSCAQGICLAHAVQLFRIFDLNHDYASKAFMTSAVVSSMEGQNLISASLPRVR